MESMMNCKHQFRVVLCAVVIVGVVLSGGAAAPAVPAGVGGIASPDPPVIGPASGLTVAGEAGPGVRIVPSIARVVAWDDMLRSNIAPPSGNLPAFDALPMQQEEPEAPPNGAASANVRHVLGGLGSAPTLGLRFKAADRSDTIDDMWPEGIRPPDTMGAVGPNHFVEAINGNVSIFDKATGYRLSSVSLLAFFAEVHTEDIPYDPRVVFDHHSGRWVVMAVDCRCGPNTIVFAVSLTDDPTGSWFLVGFPASGFADYPTLGVDADGIYIAANIAEKVWAIEKAPLLEDPPSVGTITEWTVFLDGALHPAHTYGTPGMQYFVETNGVSALRIHQLEGPLTDPTLTVSGPVAVPSFSSPPNAPALGSTVPISVGNGAGPWLQMAVFRDSSLWTAHTVAQNGRAACRWYELDPANLTLIQSGTVGHPSLHYYYPSIMVNSAGDAVMSFSGSDATQYVATYFTGRRAGDPAGQMATPVLLKEGEAPYTVLDTGGRNRWGDYSYTTLDPSDQLTFWTLQEYAESPENIWGTWVGQLSFEMFDCNGNDIDDAEDIASGASDDCDDNGVPDECQPDCNTNGVADTCDITQGDSPDEDGDGVPDECACLADLDQNGAVEPFDLALLLGFWGPNPGNPADFNGDGNVDATDLANLLSSWGPCPA